MIYVYLYNLAVHLRKCESTICQLKKMYIYIYIYIYIYFKKDNIHMGETEYMYMYGGVPSLST